MDEVDDSPYFFRPDELNLEEAGRCDRCRTGGNACAKEDEADGGLGGGAGEADEGFSTILPTNIAGYT